MAGIEQEIKLLTDRMLSRTSVLVMGAGFSYGALNGQRKPLPTDRGLSNELFDTILEKLPKDSSQYLEEYRQGRDKLKETCDNIREEHLVKKRNEYVVFSRARHLLVLGIPNPPSSQLNKLQLQLLLQAGFRVEDLNKQT